MLCQLWDRSYLCISRCDRTIVARNELKKRESELVAGKGFDGQKSEPLEGNTLDKRLIVTD
jgi:hypothetical protein